MGWVAQTKHHNKLILLFLLHIQQTIIINSNMEKNAISSSFACAPRLTNWSRRKKIILLSAVARTKINKKIGSLLGPRPRVSLSRAISVGVHLVFKHFFMRLITITISRTILLISLRHCPIFLGISPVA